MWQIDWELLYTKDIIVLEEIELTALGIYDLDIYDGRSYEAEKKKLNVLIPLFPCRRA